MIVNYVAVLVAAIASFVVGMLWYSPALFCKPWMRYVGLKEADMKKGMALDFAMGFVVTLVKAYILALFILYAEATTAFDGLKIAFLLWLGFVATFGAADVIWAHRPKGLYLINVGCELITFLVMASILAVWQ